MALFPSHSDSRDWLENPHVARDIFMLAANQFPILCTVKTKSLNFQIRWLEFLFTSRLWNFKIPFLWIFQKVTKYSNSAFKIRNFFWKIHKESISKFHNREVNKNSYHRIWKFKDFVLTVWVITGVPPPPFRIFFSEFNWVFEDFWSDITACNINDVFNHELDMCDLFCPVSVVYANISSPWPFFFLFQVSTEGVVRWLSGWANLFTRSSIHITEGTWMNSRFQ